MVEGILDPCPPYYEEKNPKNAKEKPHTAMLRVNRQIGDEAAQVLYGKNIWRVSCKKNNPFWPDTDTNTRPFGKNEEKEKIIKYMRHIVVSFDARDVDHETLAALSRERFSERFDPELSPHGPKDRAGWIHEHREGELYSPWLWKRETLDSLTLKSAVLDFSNCFCPSGCCRLFDFLWHRYAFLECCDRYSPDQREVEDIVVYGLIGDDENQCANSMGWLQIKEERACESDYGYSTSESG